MRGLATLEIRALHPLSSNPSSDLAPLGHLLPQGEKAERPAQIVAATQPSHDRIAPVVRRRSKLGHQTESSPCACNAAN